MGRKKKEDRGLKVRSLGYMQGKLKRNLYNSVNRYILTTTTFIRVGAIYAPDNDAEERQRHVGEIIHISMGLESVIANLEKGIEPDIILAQAVAESRRLIDRTDQYPASSFYHLLHHYLAEHTGSTNRFKMVARTLGAEIREAVRPQPGSEGEEKLYIASGKESDINLEKKTINKIEGEYTKLRRRLIGR